MEISTEILTIIVFIMGALPMATKMIIGIMEEPYEKGSFIVCFIIVLAAMAFGILCLISFLKNPLQF